MDEIRIQDLKVFAHHGVFEEETINGQNFCINAVLKLDTRDAGRSDDLSKSVSYADVCIFMDRYMKEHTYKLLEAVVYHMAQDILLSFELIREITLEIRKPEAPIPLPFESVSVKTTVKWHQVFVALGSNLGEKKNYLENAIEEIKKNPCCRVLQVADMIETKPYGVTDQPDFINSAALVETLYSPDEMLDFLQSLEQKANRVREYRWGPRTLDLDILFYDDEIIRTQRLLVPHPDMKNRDFVLIPMNQIAPWHIHPVYHKTIEEMLFLLTNPSNI